MPCLFFYFKKKGGGSMNYYIYNGELYRADELQHHGIKGQKWGVRRYQNSDGSLTAKGKKHAQFTREKNRRRGLTEAQTVNELKKRTANIDSENKLQKEIRAYSGDWYEGKGVSKAFKDRVTKYEKDEASLNKTLANDEKRRKEASDKYWAKLNEVQNTYLSSENRNSIHNTGKIVDKKNHNDALNRAMRDPQVVALEKTKDSISRNIMAKKTALRTKYEDDLAGIVLTDLGYKNTRKTRDIIRNVVIWD